jgi:hypothetical protein
MLRLKYVTRGQEKSIITGLESCMKMHGEIRKERYKKREREKSEQGCQ